MTRSGTIRDIRRMAKAKPTTNARRKASTETRIVSPAPRSRSGRKAGISSRANIEILRRMGNGCRAPGGRPERVPRPIPSSCPGSTRASTSFVVAADGRGWPGQARPCENGGARTLCRGEATLVVVADETPLGEDLLHLLVVLHPLDGGGERRHQLDVGMAEGVAAVAVRVLVGARLVILDDIDLPLRMVLHLGGDHRLVVEHGIDAAEGELRHHLLPVLVALHGDARYGPEPLGVVGAEQGPGLLALEVIQLVDVLRVALGHR